ncbi:MAG: hypothetical protein ABW178_10885 [Pseudoxanthomonas sp.]
MNAQALGRGLLVVATVLVIATVIAAIVVMGTPAQQRALRLDQRRANDLERIVETAREHADRTGALAKDLTTLATRPGLRLAIIDPDTAQPYAYTVLDARRFEVCATFSTDTAASDTGARASRNEDWLHPVGRQCFTRTWKRGNPASPDPSASVAEARATAALAEH